MLNPVEAGELISWSRRNGAKRDLTIGNVPIGRLIMKEEADVKAASLGTKQRRNPKLRRTGQASSSSPLMSVDGGR